MGYYRGDYYRGDGPNYYRGDPFLGAIVGAVARKVGLGKVAAKAGRWLVGKINPRSVRAAAKVVGATAGTAVVGTVASRAVTRASREPRWEDLTPEEQAEMELQSPGYRGQVGYRWGGRRPSRRLNPLNPKALKRALRRAEGFEKFARRTMNALFKTTDGRKVRKFKRSSKARS